jgi:hypothetical protein
MKAATATAEELLGWWWDTININEVQTGVIPPGEIDARRTAWITEKITDPAAVQRMRDSLAELEQQWAGADERRRRLGPPPGPEGAASTQARLVEIFDQALLEAAAREGGTTGGIDEPR